MVQGSLVAIVTPMDEQLNVNYNELKRLLEWHIEQHTDAIVILGTTGESSTLSKEEKLSIFDFTVKTVNHRIPVIAGTGSNNTAETVTFSKQVQDLGVDGVLIVTPYYNKSNTKGYIQHYKTISNALDIPIIVYNVPSRTGDSLPIEAVKEISTLANVVGIKEASGDLSYAIKVQQVTSDDFLLYSGNDDIVLPMMAIGAVGVISVAANIIPRVMHDIVQLYLQNKPQEALALQLQYLPLIESLFLEMNPIPIKQALNFTGFNVGGCRLPLYKMSPGKSAELAFILKEYDL